MTGNRTLWGFGLIILGAGLLLSGGREIGVGTIFSYFWPSMFVLPVGLFFHWLYFSVFRRRNVGVLVPGGILLVSGLICQAATLLDGWVYLWPGFIFAVAVGLFELYWFGGRNRWLLVPINILLAISLLFFLVFTLGSLFGWMAGQPLAAYVLIAAGVIFLLVQKKRA